MLSPVVAAALLSVLAVTCSSALPLYPDSSLEPPSDLFQRLVSEDGVDAANGDERENLFPLLTNDAGRVSWSKGAKDSAAQEKFSNMVDDLRETVFKLRAAEKLRSQGFIRSEQSLPRTNKRACFWKYCVTN